MSNDLNSH